MNCIYDTGNSFIANIWIHQKEPVSYTWLIWGTREGGGWEPRLLSLSQSLLLCLHQLTLIRQCLSLLSKGCSANTRHVLNLCTAPNPSTTPHNSLRLTEGFSLLVTQQSPEAWPPQSLNYFYQRITKVRYCDRSCVWATVKWLRRRYLPPLF